VSSEAGLSEAERRRRRAAVFGDVLPDATTDERSDGWSEPAGGERSDGEDPVDERLRREVPPHHG
jgi:hypothetical protein